jgi:hypothetical protein
VFGFFGMSFFELTILYGSFPNLKEFTTHKTVDRVLLLIPFELRI